MKLTSLLVVSTLFPLSEVALGIFKRSRRATATSRDRGSLAAIWLVIVLASFGAIGAQRIAGARMSFAVTSIYWTALFVLLLGLGLRWAAILTLGRFFTVNVAVHQDHRIVQDGLYRWVRHPSHSGLLLAFVGLGISFANWLSLAVLVVPILVVLCVRIAIEERSLRKAFGPAYQEHSLRTARLIPGVF